MHGKFFMTDGTQSLYPKSFHLQTIVHNVTQAIQYIRIVQLTFSTFDGCDDSKTESGTFIYFDFNHS